MVYYTTGINVIRQLKDSMRIKDFEFNLRAAGVSLLTNMAIGFAVAVTSYYLVRRTSFRKYVE